MESFHSACRKSTLCAAVHFGSLASKVVSALELEDSERHPCDVSVHVKDLGFKIFRCFS